MFGSANFTFFILFLILSALLITPVLPYLCILSMDGIEEFTLDPLFMADGFKEERRFPIIGDFLQFELLSTY